MLYQLILQKAVRRLLLKINAYYTLWHGGYIMADYWVILNKNDNKSLEHSLLEL